MKLKRSLYLIHRWFGILMCLFIFLWFASGIVMMYVEYPELTEQERMESLPSLNLEAIDIEIEALQRILGPDSQISGLSISTHLNRPVYRVQLEDGTTSVLYADSGNQVQPTTEASAEQIARIFGKNAGLGESATYLKAMEMDQWTVYGGFNNHRPLHQVALNNSKGTILYISNATGQVLRDTHAWERGWNWVGSTIHWIYPMQLRKYPDAWVNVVIVVSILGIIAIVSGTIVGFLRLKTTRYKNGSVTPYSGIQKWHHLMGIAFTLFVTTFMVSGLFSMNPFGIFNDKSSALPQVTRYQGGSLSLEGFQNALDSVRLTQSERAEIKELSWHQLNDSGVLVANTEAGRRAINFSPQQMEEKIRDTVPLLLPEDSVSQFEKLEEFDNHYYSTHNRYRPLPAYRVRFNDEEKTWYYIDAETGELLNRSTGINRVQRWLYNGLHSLDFQFLLAYRPLWDLVVIVLSIAGLALSYTSVIIGWRRFKKTKFINKHKTKTINLARG